MIGGLADHDAGAVVDEEARADLGAGVDVDAGAAVRELGDDAREQRHAELVELVREAVVDHGGEAGKREDHLVDAARGGVALEAGARVGIGKRAHIGERGGERRRHRRRVAGRGVRRAPVSSLICPCSARNAERSVLATKASISSALSPCGPKCRG